MTRNYCKLRLLDKRFAYTPSYRTDIRKTFEQHEKIFVCDIGDIRDDYEIVEQTDWLSAPGEFK